MYAGRPVALLGAAGGMVKQEAREAVTHGEAE